MADHYKLNKHELNVLSEGFKDVYRDMFAGKEDLYASIASETNHRAWRLLLLFRLKNMMVKENAPWLPRFVNRFNEEFSGASSGPAKKSPIGDLMRNDSGAVRIPGGNSPKHSFTRTLSKTAKTVTQFLGSLDFKSMSSTSLMGVGIPSKINQGKEAVLQSSKQLKQWIRRINISLIGWSRLLFAFLGGRDQSLDF